MASVVLGGLAQQFIAPSLYNFLGQGASIAESGALWSFSKGISGAAGTYIGAAIDRALFSSKESNKSGPRLSSLSIQQSTEGGFISLVYGTIRVGGIVIWTTGLQEVATTSGGGGGGSGGSGGGSYTSYTYYTDVAVIICEGEITGIRRIWADSKLIYDVSDTSSVGNLNASSSRARSIRIYSGTETQEKDPLIQAIEGDENTPAYIGTAYIVFEDLALADFGNRIPNFTFEVVKNGSISDFSKIIESGYIGEYPIIGGIFTSQLSLDGYYSILPQFADSSGLYLWKFKILGNYSMQAEQFYWPYNNLDPIFTGLRRNYSCNYHPYASPQGGYHYLVTDERNGFFTDLFQYTSNYDYGYMSADGILYYLPQVTQSDGPSSAAKKGNYIAWTTSSSNSIFITKIENLSSNNKANSSYVQIYTPTSSTNRVTCCLSESYLYVTYSKASDYKRYIARYSLEDYSYIDEIQVMNPIVLDYDSYTYTVEDNHLIFIDKNGSIYETEDFSVWSLVGSVLDSNYFPTSQQQFGYKISNNLYLVHSNPSGASLDSYSSVFSINLLNLGTISLSSVCNDILSKSGLNLSQYNTSELSDTNVNGYAIRSPSTVHSAIEPLMTSYNFNLVEVDGSIKAIKSKDAILKLDVDGEILGNIA